MTPEFQKARRHLGGRDTVLKPLIRKVGPCTLVAAGDYFAILVRSIIAQQISTKAAKAIAERLQKALGRGGFRPNNILKADEATLRGAGLSANKQRSLLDLAEKCATNVVPLRHLPEMADEEVIDALIPVRGIGRWTAEMFLIFALGRRDVLPVDDYGLRTGVQRHYGLEELPKKAALTAIGEPWRPYRSIATWFIWRSLGDVPQSEK
ncbi:MAG: DNA-3-methyladenine glycosylase 2 family protein [Armatimonadetes bacterium]|nr:DNA-3-methyladenine glycosylase 2 family protein [Armatimonadota bacterium]